MTNAVNGKWIHNVSENPEINQTKNDLLVLYLGTRGGVCVWGGGGGGGGVLWILSAT